MDTCEVFRMLGLRRIGRRTRTGTSLPKRDFLPREEAKFKISNRIRVANQKQRSTAHP